MINTAKFDYEPTEHEAEKASNSYLMSLIALIVGLPLPIINLIATLMFYVGNRKGTYFVRWHCTQALLSQLSMLLINSYGFWWTVSIIFTDETITDNYIAYLITALIFNLTEFIATIYTAVQTRKGIHISWWFYGSLTNLICKSDI
jgi:cell shape-determining protein MreD